MKSKLSEFSYGFAIVNEWLGSLGPLQAAPVFPSLIEEGRDNGGYDVKLSMPGRALFLQFKRSDYLRLPSAREFRNRTGIGLPYYRMKITSSKESMQHGMLVALDAHPNVVFYAAPLFHTVEELDDAFLSQTVRQRSFFMRPSQIGVFADEKAHFACFDGTASKVCSEPRDVPAYSAEQIDELLSKLLAEDERPFGEGPLDEALKEARNAEHRYIALENELYQERKGITREGMVYLPSEDAAERFPGAPPLKFGAARPSRAPKESEDPRLQKLQELADIGLRQFNAQLFVVQEKTTQTTAGRR
jgi:hypothetical protein